MYMMFKTRCIVVKAKAYVMRINGYYSAPTFILFSTN